MLGVIGRIFWTAILAGAVAGVLLTVIQQVVVYPIIFEAESYEVAEPSVASGEHDHDHDHEGWAPRDGLERTLYSSLTNVLVAIGFGLLLSVGFTLRGGLVGWRRGLLWGLAGFLAFNLAPALGLPPKLPGSATADLADRQIWWLLTVVLTAAGLALIAFAGRWPVKALGALLIVAPHIVGAPHPDGAEAGLPPAELEQAFIYLSLTTNGIFWLALGALAGLVFARFGPSDREPHMNRRSPSMPA